MSTGSAHTRAKLHGRPLQLTNQLVELTQHRGKGFPSIRAWGRHVAGVICALAQTNVSPQYFADYLAGWVVDAIDRQRKLDFQTACGVR